MCKEHLYSRSLLERGQLRIAEWLVDLNIICFAVDEDPCSVCVTGTKKMHALDVYFEQNRLLIGGKRVSIREVNLLGDLLMRTRNSTQSLINGV